jgi:signal transduction histidine kinase
VDDIRENVMYDNKKVNIVYKNRISINDKDLIIEADKQRIIQVMSNILDNAIKFTKEGTIRIDVEKSAGIDNDKDDTVSNNNKSEEIIINVKDTGKGLDSRTFPHLFSKFFSTSGAGGTGLGLYICKSIVEAHGGKIWAKNNNKNGKGATFFFSLPFDNK